MINGIGPTSAPIIELDRVSFRRGDVEILSNVDWRVAAHQHWAVLGPNGSGKTTLLRIACGFLWPMGGVVRRMGQELIDLRVLRESIGWVANDLVGKIPNADTAVQTVVSGKYAQIGFEEREDRLQTESDLASAAKVLDSMGCLNLRDRRFGALSQGERQQVLIARARMVDPLLIILDEPCSGMDPMARERFLAWLDGIAAERQGPALVIVTHHVEEIMPSFESTLVLKAGQIAASGRTVDVLTPALLSGLYGVQIERLERVNERLWPIWGRHIER